MDHSGNISDARQVRQKSMDRLSRPVVTIRDPYYLSYKYLFADLRDAITKYAKGDVLDIGCGNKPYYVFFKDIVTSYVGCDIVQSSDNLVDILCPATEIPLGNNVMDTVFSTQVIEHVADHNTLLAEAFRILKPGGNIILSGPMFWEHHEVPYDFFRFTKFGFEHVLTKAGFTDIQVIPNGGKWAVVGQLFLNMLRSSINKKGIGRQIVNLWYKVFFIKFFTNSLFSWLDRIDPDYSATLNFVVVAKKQ